MPEVKILVFANCANTGPSDFWPILRRLPLVAAVHLAVQGSIVPRQRQDFGFRILSEHLFCLFAPVTYVAVDVARQPKLSGLTLH